MNAKMHCYKANMRLLSRLNHLKRRFQRHLSVPAASTSDKDVQSEENFNASNLRSKREQERVRKALLDPRYPPILDLSYRAKKRREREEWHTKIKNLGTVEEKIFELNMPRYYGWKVVSMEEGVIPFDPLPQAQYITRTHLINEPGLPSYYNDILSPEIINATVQDIKGQVENALVFEYNYRDQNYQLDKDNREDESFMDNVMAKAMSQQINRILTSHLALKFAHLLESQIDHDPRIEAFWFFGGLEVPYEVARMKNQKWLEEYKNDPINQCISYKGKPILQMRHNLPLKEIVSQKDSEDTSLDIPVEPLDPRKTGYFLDHKRATIIPGFWPGDHSQFGIVSYHNRGHLTRRPKEFEDELDALKAQAIFGSFSWLYGQACYQGFSTFQDVTYPLVNQMVITNGQWWSFFVYQLNTTTMHIDSINENPRKNLCWVTEPMKLFDSISNGKVEGLNEDVLKNLIKFYANVPQEREGVEMQPYLKGEKLVARIGDPDRRIWLEEKYKHLLSNRQRHRLVPEIYHWQKIYMIDHKTRPMDKRRDFWQFGIVPYKRRLDDHTPEYIPKVCREHPRSRKKWAKTYYPEVRITDNES